MTWPPRIGDPLPRAEYAWHEQRKLEWILGKEGHGREWARVFRVESEDMARIWWVIATAMQRAAIMEVRESPYGITCGVEVGLTINDRRSLTLISWHYADEIAVPRLVTAYPIP